MLWLVFIIQVLTQPKNTTVPPPKSQRLRALSHAALLADLDSSQPGAVDAEPRGSSPGLLTLCADLTVSILTYLPNFSL